MIMITGGSFQGKTEYARAQYPDREIIVHFEEQILQCIRENRDPAAYTGQFIESHPDAVVLMDEIGNGIVPVDREEREYREAVGAAGQELAALAGEVYRVTAGIPVRIK